jgi:hypothetical protein
MEGRWAVAMVSEVISRYYGILATGVLSPGGGNGMSQIQIPQEVVGGEDVGRVEVVVERGPGLRDIWFAEWLSGWLRDRYVVDAYFFYPDMDVFHVEADVFELVARVYREALHLRWVLRAEVNVAVCGGGECVVVACSGRVCEDEEVEENVLVLLPEDEVEKLRMVEKKVEELIKKDARGIDMFGIDRGGIWLRMGGCEVFVFKDEAVALSALLLDALYRGTKNEVFRELSEEVRKVFDPDEFSLDVRVDVLHKDTYCVALNGREVCLSYEEVLNMVYDLLSLAIIGFSEDRIIAEEDYGLR